MWRNKTNKVDMSQDWTKSAFSNWYRPPFSRPEHKCVKMWSDTMGMASSLRSKNAASETILVTHSIEPSQSEGETSHKVYHIQCKNKCAFQELKVSSPEQVKVLWGIHADRDGLPETSDRLLYMWEIKLEPGANNVKVPDSIPVCTIHLELDLMGLF